MNWPWKKEKKKEEDLTDPNRKTVVYASDRKLYKHLPTVVNSLLKNNPDIDRVYLFLEDTEFPLINHPKVHIRDINVFKKYMAVTSPQYKYYLPFATFVRLWLAEELEESRVLWLDVDTIVDGDISGLWKINLGGKFVAGARDLNYNNFEGCTNYMNAGVMLFNLAAWREHKLSLEATCMVNTQHHKYGDQDIINKLCKNNKAIFDNRYNYGRYTNYMSATKPIIIYHWTGHPKCWDF